MLFSPNTRQQSSAWCLSTDANLARQYTECFIIIIIIRTLKHISAMVDVVDDAT